MADDPNKSPEPKFDPASRELLSTEMTSTERSLDEIAQRPIEMHQEALETISKLPPISGVLAALLSIVLALSVVPYAISWNGNLWTGWSEKVEEAKRGDEIRQLPKYRNMLPSAVIVPLALVCVALGFLARWHRVGMAALWIGSLALAESLGAAGFYEWQDGKKREELASAKDVKRAEAAELLRRQQEEGRVKREAAERKAEEDRRLAEEERQKKAGESAEANRERESAENDASFRADQERQRQEAEKKAQERKRLADTEEDKQRAEIEQQLAEVQRSKTREERSLKQARERMETAATARDKQALALKEQEQQTADWRTSIEANEKQIKTLTGQLDELNGSIRVAEQTIDSIKDQRVELRKQSKAANYKGAMARLAEDESNAKERKAAATKSLRESDAQIKALQRQNDLSSGNIKRSEADLAKKAAEIDEMDRQLAEQKAAQEKQQQVIADLGIKAEKLKASLAQGAAKP